MRLPALARCHAADHLRAIGQRLFGMKCALLPGETLAKHFGIFIDEDAHEKKAGARSKQGKTFYLN